MSHSPVEDEVELVRPATAGVGTKAIVEAGAGGVRVVITAAGAKLQQEGSYN